MPHRSRVLVTGGAGFIGRRVAGALLAEGHQVTVADLRPHPDGDRVRSVIGDLTDPRTVAQAVEPGTDAIIHLAAVTSVLESVKDPVRTYRLNVDATARLLETARENEVRTFVLASTNAVVGGGAGAGSMNESATPRPLTPYGATKAAAEMILSAYTSCYGIAGVALRFSNVYGPGMAEKDSFIPRLMRAARDGEGVQVRGDGSMRRDVVHVDDVVQGMLLAWHAGATGPLILGSGQSVTVNEMVRTAREITGQPIPAEHVPEQPGEMAAVVLDISAISELGYRPRYDLARGMATVWPDFRGQVDGGTVDGGTAL